MPGFIGGSQCAVFPGPSLFGYISFWVTSKKMMSTRVKVTRT
jgi:hypothetical protein